MKEIPPVKTDAPVVAPQPISTTSPAPTMTGEQVVEMMKLLFASNAATTQQLAELIPKAVAEATMKQRQWWDEAEFPDISKLNPLGEKDHPRPLFNRGLFWLGYRCQENEHTREEIELMNTLKPGKFHMHDPLGNIERRDFFEVREITPGVPKGDLLVVFPCQELSDRMLIERYARGRGMVDLLLEMVPAVPVAATVAA